MNRPDPVTRARAYLQKSAPRSVAGQGGDNTTHAVACTLAVDFGLDDAHCAALLSEYNRDKCDPQWGERDLARHLRSARRTANAKPGEVGKLLRQDRADYTGPRSPTNNAAPAKPAVAPQKPAPSGYPPPNPQTRTARTPFFNVRRAGEGAEPRTARTIRTLPVSSLPISNSSSSPRLEESKKEVSEKSEPKPATKPAPVPVERLDVTTIWSDGEVTRALYGKPERHLGNINARR
jgi:hypothetical protein